MTSSLEKIKLEHFLNDHCAQASQNKRLNRITSKNIKNIESLTETSSSLRLQLRTHGDDLGRGQLRVRELLDQPERV